ncbi:MAG: M56 family metallopeptidase [Chitinophagaceae bacterium]|nr:M56 family metallopeptidase [Chitinophagaceae bacterium]
MYSLGWAVLNSFWQMALIWVLWQIIALLTPGVRSGVRSRTATFLLFAGFGWFGYTFIQSLQDIPGETLNPAQSFVAGVSPALHQSLLQYLPVISVVYLVLMIVPVFRFIRNIRYVNLIRTYGLQKISADWRIFTNAISQQLGIRKKVKIWISDFVSSPVTIGFLKPVILIPLAAINNLEPAQLEAVILHELAHIRRYDYLVNLLVNVIRTILYLNPFVKALARDIEHEREKSCDELVLQFQYDAYQYATALLQLEKSSHDSKPLLLPAGGHHKNDLLKRVEVLLGIQESKLISWGKISSVCFALLCTVGMQWITAPRTKSLIETEAISGYAASGLQATRLNYPYSEQNQPVRNPEIHRTRNVYPDIPVIPENKGIFNRIEYPEGIIPASMILDEPVALSKEEEAQVKKAIEDSRKVLENVQWKNVEANIADVLDTREKAALRSSYKKAMSKLDWNQWENKLRNAYDKVNWEQVNEQLAFAVNQVKLDSLQTVYTAMEKKLRKVEEALESSDVTGIPDSDISLKTIEEKKQMAEELLRKIKATRGKKIVHL